MLPGSRFQILQFPTLSLEFVESGGYTDQRWWTDEGWRFVQDLNVQGPRFWIDRSKYRSLLEEVSMPWSLPVVVNNLEAEAFCNWKSQQLGKRVDSRFKIQNLYLHYKKKAGKNI